TRRTQLIRGVNSASNQESQPPEARLLQSVPKPIEALKRGENVRAHIRTLLQEALNALLEVKQAGIVQNRGMGECALLQAQLGDSESARQTLGHVKDLLQALPQRTQAEE